MKNEKTMNWPPHSSAPLHPRTSTSGARPFYNATLVAVALAAAATLAWSDAHAEPPVKVGQRLGEQQIQSLGALRTVQIDGKPHRVVHTSTTRGGLVLTLLIDPDGVVGQSYHEVVIAALPPSTVRQQAAAALAPAVEIKPYERLKLTVARYATIEQAATGLSQLRAALPDAELSLPVATSILRTQ